MDNSYYFQVKSGILMTLWSTFVTIVNSFVMGFPLWLSWNYFAPTYLKMLPNYVQHIGYLETVCFILVCSYVGGQIQNLIPSLITINKE